MKRNGCATGKTQYEHKADVPGGQDNAKRCDRCRCWHAKTEKGKNKARGRRG